MVRSCSTRRSVPGFCCCSVAAWSRTSSCREQGFRRRLAAHQLRMGHRVFAGVYTAFNRGTPEPRVSSLAPQLIAGRHHRSTGPLLLRGEFLGAVLGALLYYLAYKQHFDEEDPPQARRLLHRPGHPQLRLELRHGGHRHLRADLRHPGLRQHPDSGSARCRGPARGRHRQPLGGPTGYAINPARDLGPRIAHALLPIKGKGSATGGTPGSPSSAPLSVRSSPPCCSRRSVPRT